MTGWPGFAVELVWSPAPPGLIRLGGPGGAATPAGREGLGPPERHRVCGEGGAEGAITLTVPGVPGGDARRLGVHDACWMRSISDAAMTYADVRPSPILVAASVPVVIRWRTDLGDSPSACAACLTVRRSGVVVGMSVKLRHCLV